MLFSTHYVAVVGSRSRTDKEYIHKKLDELHSEKPIELIVSGGARGVDLIAEEWADLNKIPKKIFIPDWDKYGKKAGFLRNIEIVNHADVVYSFWDGESRGTLSSMNLAKKNNKKLIVDIDERR